MDPTFDTCSVLIPDRMKKCILLLIAALVLLSGRGVTRGPAPQKYASSSRDFCSKVDENKLAATGHVQTRPTHALSFHPCVLLPGIIDSKSNTKK